MLNTSSTCEASATCEFQQKTRSTDHAGKWKATEFRIVLLYAASIVSRYVLDDDRYDHFLFLFVACRILCYKILCNQYAMHVKQYLRTFFVAMKDLYGPESKITNAHNLIHLADDAVNTEYCSRRTKANEKVSSYPKSTTIVIM